MQVDFVMSYTQAPIEMDMWIELPAGIETKHCDSKSHALKLLKNLKANNKQVKFGISF